jgi:exosortase/archaeosortase family protein
MIVAPEGAAPGPREALTCPPAAMKRGDYAFAGLLACLGAFIWWRDLRWLASASDTLPILAALPLFVWLNTPWTLHGGPCRLARRPLALALVLFPAGILFDSTLVLAIAWTVLLWSWIAQRVGDPALGASRRLLVLPVIAFPWIANDFERIGWWCRISGATAADHVLGWMGFDVVRRGTFMLIDGFSVSVEPACSGVNGLQAMLVAGAALAYLRIRDTRLFWWNLLLLPAAAWTANVLRIVFASAMGASMAPADAARWVGPLHLGAGWVALAAMFGLCWLVFGTQDRLARTAWGARWRTLPWAEGALLAYASWRTRDLLTTWFSAPFDRFGWAAFALWILPLAWVSESPRGQRRHLFWAAGVVLIVLGDVGDLNVCHHAGLALVLMGFAPARMSLLWALGAIAWIPAFGWVASRLGFSPVVFATMRVSLSALALMAARPRRGRVEEPLLSYAGH